MIKDARRIALIVRFMQRNGDEVLDALPECSLKRARVLIVV
jgi:hypothetical protein